MFVGIALKHAAGQECVDWACTMLERGYDGEHLRVLAAASPPYNHFAIAELRDKAFAETGTVYPGVEASAYAYAAERAQCALDGTTSVRAVLRELSDLSIASDRPMELTPFHHLKYMADDPDQWIGAEQSVEALFRDLAVPFIERYGVRT